MVKLDINVKVIMYFFLLVFYFVVIEVASEDNTRISSFCY